MSHDEGERDEAGRTRPPLSEVEEETLRLLRQHGVKVEAIGNFDAEPTLVVDSSPEAEQRFSLPPLPAIRELSDAELVEHTSAQRLEFRPPGPTPLVELFEMDLPSRPVVDALWVRYSDNGLRVGAAFPLDDKRLIGRGGGCDPRIPDDSVSRVHALVERSDDTVRILDVNSRNGLLVNGQRLQGDAVLKNGDVVQIARTAFEVVLNANPTRVFISYGGPDHYFCDELRVNLELEGFEVFFFPRTTQERFMGERIATITRTEIQAHDIVVLVCSERGMRRPGVLAELQHLLAREEREGGYSLMIPITLDDYVFSWEPTDKFLADSIRERVIGDFKGVGAQNRGLRVPVRRLAAAIRRLSRSYRERQKDVPRDGPE